MNEAALARKREEHRDAFRRRVVTGESLESNPSTSQIDFLVKRIAETRSLLYVAEERASKAELELKKYLDHAGDQDPTLTERSESAAALLGGSALARAMAAEAECERLQESLASSATYDVEVSTLRTEIENLRHAEDRSCARAAAAEARLLEVSNTVGSIGANEVKSNQRDVLFPSQREEDFIPQTRGEADTLGMVEKAIEVAAISRLRAELHSSRSALAAESCRAATSQARCEAAQAQSEALQRAIPALKHAEGSCVSDSDELEVLHDTVEASTAVGKALHAELESLITGGKSVESGVQTETVSTSGDQQDDFGCDHNDDSAARVKQLLDELETSEAKVKILEAHLSKMDAHLAALAHGDAPSDAFEHIMSDEDDDVQDILPAVTSLGVAEKEAIAEESVPHKQQLTPIVSREGTQDAAVLHQELEYVVLRAAPNDSTYRFARAALEGADAARHEVQERLKSKEELIETLNTRVENLERDLATACERNVAAEQARERDSSEGRAQLLAAEASVQQSRDAAAMLAEEVSSLHIKQADKMAEYQRDVDAQSAALSAQLTDAISANVAVSARDDAIAKACDLEEVVLKCTSTIESLKASLAAEHAKSEQHTFELRSAARERADLLKEVDAARTRADILASRADVADARVETALEKIKTGEARVDAADLRAKDAESRIARAELETAEARKAKDIAARERDVMVRERDAAVVSAQSKVAAAEEECEKLRDHLEKERDNLSGNLDEAVREAHADRDAATVAAAALRQDFRRERANILEERDIIVSAAREETALFRQRSLDYEAAAAKAYAECAAVRSAGDRSTSSDGSSRTSNLPLSAIRREENVDVPLTIAARALPNIFQSAVTANDNVDDAIRDIPSACSRAFSSHATRYEAPFAAETDFTVVQSTAFTRVRDASSKVTIGTSTNAAFMSAREIEDESGIAHTSRNANTQTIGTLIAADDVLHKESQADDWSSRGDSLRRMVSAQSTASVGTETEPEKHPQQSSLLNATNPTATPYATGTQSTQFNRAQWELDATLKRAPFHLNQTFPKYSSQATWTNQLETGYARTERVMHAPFGFESVEINKRLAIRLLVTTIACHTTARVASSVHRLISMAAWKNFSEKKLWHNEAICARGRVALLLLRCLTRRRTASALRAWQRGAMSRTAMPSQYRQEHKSGRNEDINVFGHKMPRSGIDAVDRVAAMAANVSAAAKIARGNFADMALHSSQPSSKNQNPVLFRRSIDASGGVLGIDGNELCVTILAILLTASYFRRCASFQFGNCEHQTQNGLVMHRALDGGVTWQWHACVACARVTGRLATHARFGVNGEATQCPVAEHANDRLYEVLPCEMRDAKAHVSSSALQQRFQSANSRLRFQEQCIKNYERQRSDLMSALGAALMRLNSLQTSYPRWIWEKYEQNRSERYTYFSPT